MAAKPLPPVLPSIEALIAGAADLSLALITDAASVTTTKARDLVIAGPANSVIATGGGADILIDRGGSDRVNLGAGDDVYIYDAAANSGARDVVTGGLGNDTLVLNLTGQEWLGSALQADIARILVQMGTPAASGATLGAFKFQAFNLAVNGFDAVRVFVDGQELSLANDPVTARADSFAMQEGGQVTGSVTLNDTVADRVSSVQLVTAPTEGALTFAPDGSFTFDAGAGFDGLAAGQTHDVTFVYRVTDANGDSAEALATVTITGTNDLPVISGDIRASVVEDLTQTASGRLTATDPDLTDSVSFSGSARGTFGALTVDATGAWSYALANPTYAVQHLAAGQVAQEIFTVAATDSQGAVVTQQIVVEVTGTNDAPVIVGTTYGAVMNAAPMQATTGKLALSDVDGDALTVITNGTSTYGSFAVDGTGVWTYRLDPTSAAYAALVTGATVTETFDVTATDSHGASTTRSVSVDVVGMAPAPGSMVLDQTRLGDFAGLLSIPGPLGMPLLANNQRQQIATSGPVSDFTMLFSTDFLTAGNFDTTLTPNAHLHVIAANSFFGANVVTLAATNLITDVYTGAGSDLVSVRGGTAFGSTFDGGSGTDTLEINALTIAHGQSIDASALFTSGEIAVNGTPAAWHATGFEAFRFTGVAQTVTGTERGDLMTDRGETSLFGGAGADTFISARLGKGAASALYGGEGNDLFLGQGAAISREGDIIDGGAGVDGLTLSNVVALDASAGTTFDALTQGGMVHVRDVEVLTINGTAGTDTLIGGAGDDKLTGNFGDDLLQGGAGNDVLDGGWGNDSLSGGAGNDLVYGGSGDDWLSGFLGSDTLNGGTGADTFDLTPAGDAGTTIFIQGYGVSDGADWVTGFDPTAGAGHDVVSINQIHAADGLLVDSFARMQGVSHQTVDGVLLDFGGGSSLMLAGLTLDQLSADDFTFA